VQNKKGGFRKIRKEIVFGIMELGRKRIRIGG
jgi:hypothetical protein